MTNVIRVPRRDAKLMDEETAMPMERLASTLTAIALAATLMVPLTALVKAHVAAPSAPSHQLSLIR
jgi:hypothetical protein